MLAPMDEEFRVTRSVPNDLLAGMIPLPTHPPDFVPGKCFTQERSDNLDLNPANWLWSDELKLVRWIMCEQEMALAWTLLEHG